MFIFSTENNLSCGSFLSYFKWILNKSSTKVQETFGKSQCYLNFNIFAYVFKESHFSRTTFIATNRSFLYTKLIESNTVLIVSPLNIVVIIIVIDT